MGATKASIISTVKMNIFDMSLIRFSLLPMCYTFIFCKYVSINPTLASPRVKK